MHDPPHPGRDSVFTGCSCSKQPLRDVLSRVAEGAHDNAQSQHNEEVTIRLQDRGTGGRTAVDTMETTTLPIRVDKSHLVTIGERLYTESIELIRELVNNAYDADATEVRVTIDDYKIVVADNGLGMDLEGLREYFTIGTPDKRLNPRSARFGRMRIGQFGIGKFATLSACERFTVGTQRGAFAAEVIFDKDEWERDGNRWDLPLKLLPPDSARGDGTIVLLSRLRRRFDPVEVERHLLDSVPLRAPEFAVFLNARRLLPLQLPGHRIPVLQGTPYGPIQGEIVVVPAHLASTLEMGIEIKVRQVTVRRELFGMEAWGREAARVKGEIHADFLPVTADRSGFVRDSDEYRAFVQVIHEVIEDVHRTLGRLSDRKERKRARQAVKEAFHLIQQALAKNPDLSPFGPVALAAVEPKAAGGGGVVPEKRRRRKLLPDGQGVLEANSTAVADQVPAPAVAQAAEPRKRKPRVRKLTPHAVVHRTRLGETGVTCCLDHFGPEATEAFHEGATIYINTDHPLYHRNSHRRETHTLHLTRLLTQEISLMKDPRTPRQAFERQSKLLRDAFIGEGE